MWAKKKIQVEIDTVIPLCNIFEVVLSCEIMQNLFSSLKGSTMLALLTEHSCLVSVFKSVTFESQHWG